MKRIVYVYFRLHSVFNRSVITVKACSGQRIESRAKLADDKGGLKCRRLMYVVGHFAISPNDRVR